MSSSAPSPLFQQADRFRNALLNNERKAASAMVQAWGTSWQRLNVEVRALAESVALQRAAGKEPSKDDILRLEHYRALIPQAETELRRLIPYAETTILQQQQAAVDAARTNAPALIQAALPIPDELKAQVNLQFNRLPVEATQSLVGVLQDGSPLADLLAELGPATQQGFSDALVTGLVAGFGPAKIAENVRDAFGLGLNRALNISRTETLRAYRAATIMNYQANSDVVKGYRRQSALTVRTCPTCWALHGTWWPLDAPFDEHNSGRCTAIPDTKSLAELGITGVPETPVEVARGVDVFNTMTEADQRAILGPGKYDLFKAGKITLADMVQQDTHPRWGTTRREASIAEALANASKAKPWLRYNEEAA